MLRGMDWGRELHEMIMELLNEGTIRFCEEEIVSNDHQVHDISVDFKNQFLTM